MQGRDGRADIRIDIRRLKCPFTLLEVSNAIRKLKRGQVLEIAVDSQEMADEVRSFIIGLGLGLEQEASIWQASDKNEPPSDQALILTFVMESG